MSIQLLFQLFVHVVTRRFKTGQKLSIQEKSQLLNSLYMIGINFFSKYISNDENALGNSWMAISARDNLCLPGKSDVKDQEEISEILQNAPICSPVSSMQRGVRVKYKKPFPKTNAKSRYFFKMARKGSQSS